jgi:hypothetical protein
MTVGALGELLRFGVEGRDGEQVGAGAGVDAEDEVARQRERVVAAGGDDVDADELAAGSS